MERTIKWLESIGILFCIIFYYVFHYMYDWINTLGFMFPVRESVWEHIKIVFMPYFIYSIIELFILKPHDKLNYIAIKSISLLTIPIVIIVIFYTYSGIIGTNWLAVDIIIGLISIAIAYIISIRLLLIDYKVRRKATIIASLGGLLFLIVIFTYYPPKINLFM